MKRCAAWLAISIGAALAVPVASAATMSWTNPSGGTFADGANWSGGNAPVAGDTAVFNLGSVAGYTVEFDANAQSTHLWLGTDKNTLDLNGNTYTVSNNVLVAQNAGNVGTMSIANGVFENGTGGQILIGNAGNSLGTLVVAGGTLKAQNSLHVGLVDTSVGNLVVQNGGRLETKWVNVGTYGGSTGHVTLTGAGSTWQGIASIEVARYGGTGSVTIEDGARFTATASSQVFHLGYVANGTGSMTVSTGTDAEPAFSVAQIHVGRAGTGTLTVNNGGVIKPSALRLAQMTGSQGSLLVTDGAKVVTGLVSLGGDSANSGGTGSVIISNGGTLHGGGLGTAGTPVIGYGATSNVSMTVTGIGSRFEANNKLWIGNSATGGVGRLTVSDGATAFVTAEGFIYPTGTLTLSGGTFGAQTYMENRGRIEGSGAFNVPWFNSYGTIDPGTAMAAGRIDVVRYAEQPGSILAIDLGGTNQGAAVDGYDYLKASSQSTLAGTLAVGFIDDFLPRRSDSFTVLTSSARAGAFAAVTYDTTVVNSMTVSYTDVANGVVLKNFDLFPIADIAKTSLGGGLFEFDGRGSYDPDDTIRDCQYLSAFDWLLNGTSVSTASQFSLPLAPGIYNLALWVTDDETTQSSISLNFTVPEPSSLLLLGLSALALLRRSRRSIV